MRMVYHREVRFDKVVAVMELASFSSSGDALLGRGRRSGTCEVSRGRSARGREGTGGEGALFCLGSLEVFMGFYRKWQWQWQGSVQPRKKVKYFSLCWIQKN